VGAGERGRPTRLGIAPNQRARWSRSKSALWPALSPDLTGGQTGIEVHTLGNSSNGKDEVGGPGSQKASHACDGKGIDYLDACAGA